jgi:hypothetical protein
MRRILLACVIFALTLGSFSVVDANASSGDLYNTVRRCDATTTVDTYHTRGGSAQAAMESTFYMVNHNTISGVSVVNEYGDLVAIERNRCPNAAPPANRSNPPTVPFANASWEVALDHCIDPYNAYLYKDYASFADGLQYSLNFINRNTDPSVIISLYSLTTTGDVAYIPLGDCNAV